MYELKKSLHTVKVEKRVLIGTSELQVAQVRTLSADEKNLNSFHCDWDERSEIDKNCQKSGDVYSGLKLQKVRVASKLLKFVARCRVCEVADLCLFEDGGDAGIVTP